MSKSMVEKYEQMLAQDPTSTVFVELARAYLDRGDNDRAITTCQQGIGHHPNSVVGRVLWGKALINVGKAAEAMKQFDLATGVDKDNPHAYNLIGEALLRKGLYRSALPILRKAAALQPNDHRIAQWLDQAKAALSGGPTPVLYDATTVDASATMPTPVPSAESAPPELGDSTVDPTTPAIALVPPEARRTPPPPPVASAPRARPSGPRPAPSQPSRPPPEPPSADEPPDAFAAFLPGRPDPQSEPTQVLSALTDLPVVPSLENALPPPVLTRELPAETSMVLQSRSADGRSTMEIPAPAPSEPPVILGEAISGETRAPEAPDPFTMVSPRTDSGDTFRGLTSTFDALADGASAAVPHAIPKLSPAPAAGTPAAAQRLLEDIVSAQSAVPTIEFRTVGVAAQPPVPDASRVAAPPPPKLGGLLDEIPDDSLVEAPFVPPRVELNTQTTEAIAREYERELREKLEVTRAQKTFTQRHGRKLVGGAAVLVVVLGLGGSFLFTRARNQGETLDSALAKGLTGVAADTREQYGAAVRALDQALTMDDDNTTALATRGYAHAMLFAEHGRDPKEREAALASLTPAARSAFPEVSIVVDYLTAQPAALAAARQQLLDSPVDKSLVHAHVGRVLLADHQYDDALTRLKKAIELDPRQTIALVALGEYYLSFEDWDTALEMMSRAEPLSRSHPARVIGQAWARLELSRELPEALTDLEALPKGGAIPEAQAGRYQLMLGRALSANGRHDEALKLLLEGATTHAKTLGFEFQMALAGAYRAAGQMANAQKAFEDAAKLNPKSEEAKAGLGRVLLARSRERELLDRVKYEKDQRKVALVRGIAWSRLGDQRKVREELAHTQIGGKTPAEAAVYFALADAADDPQRAIEVLEKVLPQTRQKATVQVALARVYMQKNQLDKARAQLEDASKDPQDYEGNALLGQLLLDAGLPPEMAVEHLQRAVDRNGSHAPSRHLLTRALLALGHTDQALKGIDAWVLDNPSLELAWKDAALAWLQAGRLKDAENAVTKLSPTSDDLESWRIRARVLFARGNGSAAMAALERANKLNPKDAETFCEIGFAFVRQGNGETALKAFEAASREAPKAVCAIAGPSHARPTTRGKPSPVLVVTGLIAKSNDVWEKAFLQATLSRLLLEDRNLKEATAQAEEAVATAPASPFAHFALAEVLNKQRSVEKARDEYQKAAELDGSWSGVHLALADLLARMGGDALPRALAEYELVSNIDQNELEVNRAKRAALALRKQLKTP